jgi:hypothetical protein
MLNQKELNQKEPGFLAENQSVASLVSQLHNYFKNTYSQFKTQHSIIVSQFHAATEEEKPQLSQQLLELEAEMSIFGALSDSLSVANRLLHTRSVIKELGVDNSVYIVHHEKNL